MKLYKTIPTFILLLTGYFCENMQVAANKTVSEEPASSTASTALISSLPSTSVIQTPESEIQEEDRGLEGHLQTSLVAGLSIFFMFLFIIVTVSIVLIRKRSKEQRRNEGSPN